MEGDEEMEEEEAAESRLRLNRSNSAADAVVSDIAVYRPELISVASFDLLTSR